jgi:hypothetical protein
MSRFHENAMSAAIAASTESPPAALPKGEDQKIMLPGQTPQGQHILSVLVKRTYDFGKGGRCVRSAADKKLVPGDVHYGDPMNSTVRFESDFAPFKVATDVVLIGKAYAPGGQRTLSFTASLVIGQQRKELLIMGDRVARFQAKREPVFTDPQPFESMELRYERAYGGVDVYSDPKVPYVYPRNHLGRGFAVVNTQRAVENLPLPNLEDPNDRLTPARLCVGEFKHWERQPMPQSFCWTMKMWRPRSGFAGIMPADRALEQELRKAYSTLVPPAQKEMYAKTQLPDMDFRFFNGASAGLALPFLSGTEQVGLVNLDPQGKTVFQLPGEKPRIGVDIGQGNQEPVVFLHTIQIRMEDRQVDLVWRGAVPYGGPDSLPELKKMDVTIA